MTADEKGGIAGKQAEHVCPCGKAFYLADDLFGHMITCRTWDSQKSPPKPKVNKNGRALMRRKNRSG